jgi:hypothetical protein
VSQDTLPELDQLPSAPSLNMLLSNLSSPDKLLPLKLETKTHLLSAPLNGPLCLDFEVPAPSRASFELACFFETPSNCEGAAHNTLLREKVNKTKVLFVPPPQPPTLPEGISSFLESPVPMRLEKRLPFKCWPQTIRLKLSKSDFFRKRKFIWYNALSNNCGTIRSSYYSLDSCLLTEGIIVYKC